MSGYVPRFQHKGPLLCACECNYLVEPIKGRPSWYHSRFVRGHKRRVSLEHRKEKLRLKELNSSRRFKRLYGITKADYARMLHEQTGGCKLCGRPPMKNKLHVDHDHTTKRVRGLLCGRCNWVLGLVKDSATLLQAMAAYV